MAGEFEEIFGGPDAAVGQVVVRTGVVLASPQATAARVSVQVDEDGELLPPMPFVGSYVPKPGDLVWVLFSTSPGGSLSGIVVGGKAGQSGNMVLNPNFYAAPILTFPPVNAPPYNWYRYVASGAVPSLFCQVMRQTVMRFIGNVAAASGATANDTYVYSAAIPVVGGKSYLLTTAGHASVFASTALLVQSRVAWFADTSDYPNFISETQFGTDSLGAITDTDIYHYGTLTAPATATYARVVMRQQWTGASPGGNMMWAEVVMMPA